jgi:methylated-DNA-[protein]-cysteine S-methyltransferase
MTLRQTSMRSPVGRLRLVASDDALVGVYLPGLDSRASVQPPDERTIRHPVLATAREQLAAYFAGERQAFELPLAPEGTAFQRAVWRALTDIPFGSTCSYAAIAAAIGRPSATRAVGAANGRNPISIIVPCHRVIGADGSLTGYAGGLACKRWLLAHEGVSGVQVDGAATMSS